MADNSSGAAGAALQGDAGAAGGDGGGAGSAKPWYDGANLKPEQIGLLEAKGWNKDGGLSGLIDNYGKVEKMWREKTDGLIALPKDENDTAALDALFAKLGRPESPDKYTFPEGVDPEQIKALAPELHKLGLTQKQAAALAAIDIQRMQRAQAAINERTKADGDQADRELRSEWGPKFEENIEFARRAMRGNGWTLDKDFGPLAQAIGAKKALTLLALAGRSTREDNAAAIGDAAAGFGMTPNRASLELQQKGKELLAAARAGDKGAMAQWQRLQKAKSGED